MKQLLLSGELQGRSLDPREGMVVMGDVMTNLRVLKPSRKRLNAGDLLAMQLPDECYLFGRVITTEARIGPMDGVILIGTP